VDGQPTKRLSDALDLKGFTEEWKQTPTAHGDMVNLIYVSVTAGYSSLELKIRARQGVDYFEHMVNLGKLEYTDYKFLNNGTTDLYSQADILKAIEANTRPKQTLAQIERLVEELEAKKAEIKAIETKLPYYAY
jgi:hypothetical protein